jgi:hypothetical protein
MSILVVSRDTIVIKPIKLEVVQQPPILLLSFLMSLEFFQVAIRLKTYLGKFAILISLFPGSLT